PDARRPAAIKLSRREPVEGVDVRRPLWARGAGGAGLGREWIRLRRPWARGQRDGAHDLPEDIPALDQRPQVLPGRIPRLAVGRDPPEVTTDSVEQVARGTEVPEVLTRPPVDRPQAPFSLQEFDSPGQPSRRGACIPGVARIRPVRQPGGVLRALPGRPSSGGSPAHGYFFSFSSPRNFPSGSNWTSSLSVPFSITIS